METHHVASCHSPGSRELIKIYRRLFLPSAAAFTLFVAAFPALKHPSPIPPATIRFEDIIIPIPASRHRLLVDIVRGRLNASGGVRSDSPAVDAGACASCRGVAARADLWRCRKADAHVREDHLESIRFPTAREQNHEKINTRTCPWKSPSPPEIRPSIHSILRTFLLTSPILEKPCVRKCLLTWL